MTTLSHVRGAPEHSFERSAELYAAARDLIAGGVTSAVRAAELPHPLYFDHGTGPRIWDVDGNVYVDYALGYGPLILGHSPDQAILSGLAGDRWGRGHPQVQSRA